MSLVPHSFVAAAALAAGAAGSALAQHSALSGDDVGAALFAANCVSCHGESGDAIAGIDLGRGRFRRPLTDRELAAVIIGDAAEHARADLDEDEVELLVAFLRDNARPREEPRLAGDAARGQALFEGKGECTRCHRIDGRGSRVGPDLSRIGRSRRAGDILASLLDPAAEVRPSNRFYRVVTSAGDEVTGRLLNHDTFTVQLLDMDERLRSFRKADLREHGFVDSPMPSYRDKLTEQEIADLVAYLVSRR